MSEQDRSAIIQVINLYGLAIDARRWDLFDRVFTQDILVSYPDGSSWHDLPAFKAGFEAMHEPLHHTQHAMLNHLVTVSGDTATAFTYVSSRLIMRDAEGDDVREVAAWYDDDLIRSGGNWLIRRRDCQLTWARRTRVPAAEVAAMEAELRSTQVRDAAKAGTITLLNGL